VRACVRVYVNVYVYKWSAVRSPIV